ncbi:MAG: DUF1080 domain-containing protein [Verrucomicrobiae bacterium]|nr:DUF1080 domain-containing protein [Verrucomicrobiae bacterium]MCB1235331.1 DUF1080 domain-containing protein [Verrucomicrobiae bacterium]
MKNLTIYTFLLGLAAIGIADDSLDFTSLDDFRDPQGWEIVKSVTADSEQAKQWKTIEPGTGLLINGSAGKAGNLVTKGAVGDCEVDIEFMIPKGSNSGIYFQECYEIQILDSYGKADNEISVHDCGAIYERWDENRDPKGYEGTLPTTNACKAPGEWQTYHIVFRAPRFDDKGKKTENARFVKVVFNGKVIHENVECTGPTRGGAAKEVSKGPFRIQGDHGPVAFRKFSIKPLSLD